MTSGPPRLIFILGKLTKKSAFSIHPLGHSGANTRPKKNFLIAALVFKRRGFENYVCSFFPTRVSASNINFRSPIHFLPGVAISDIDELEKVDIQPPHPDCVDVHESSWSSSNTWPTTADHCFVKGQLSGILFFFPPKEHTLTALN